MYRIITDSCSNLTNEIIDKFGIEIISLTYLVNGEEYISYKKGEKNDLKPFYEKMRARANASTSAINENDFYNAFEAILKNDEDLLYIGFSSGLSSTYSNAINAIERLKKEYKNRKIYAVDSLAASMGEGLLVYHACQHKEQGESIDEVRNWLEENKLKLAHWFTVDDLYFLFKGGRVGRLSYLVGTLAKIKPILHVDDAGKLVPVGRVMGRKKSLITLVENICETITDPENQTIFVSHGDCQEDVDFVIEKMKERINAKDYVVGYIDPVVGTHSGPGTLAIYALCEHR